VGRGERGTGPPRRAGGGGYGVRLPASNQTVYPEASAMLRPMLKHPSSNERWDWGRRFLFPQTLLLTRECGTQGHALKPPSSNKGMAGGIVTIPSSSKGILGRGVSIPTNAYSNKGTCWGRDAHKPFLQQGEEGGYSQNLLATRGGGGLFPQSSCNKGRRGVIPTIFLQQEEEGGYSHNPFL
jgi:hypothetical protein